MKVKYPDIVAELVGKDGNVYTIIGRVADALRRAGIPYAERRKFIDAATDADSYDEVLRIVQSWVTVN